MRPDDLLGRVFDEVQQSDTNEYLVNCPFHEDDRPSCSINTAKELFHCHGCKEKGSLGKILAKATEISEPHAKSEWDRAKGDFEEPKYNFEEHQKRLFNYEKGLTFLQKERHWDLDIIRKLRLGYDGNRVSIPVMSPLGYLINIRYYKPGARKNEPKVINEKGYGKAALFCDGGFKSPNIYIFEGEPDCIAAMACGLSAISATSGAGHFDAQWGQRFRGKDVYVCYDADGPGKKGAKRTATIVSKSAETVSIVDIEPHLKEGKDFTDYLTEGGTRQSFEEICKASERFSVSEDLSLIDEQVEAFEVSLAESSEEQYYRKRVKMYVMVSGKTLSPYIIPKKIRVHCDLPNMAMCKSCHLGFVGGEKYLEFDHRSDVTLQLVETGTESHGRIFKKLAGVSQRCGVFEVDVIEAQNIEEAKVIPNLDFSTDDSEYVIRQIFCMMHGLRPNSPYMIEGITIPHPRTQQVTYLIDKAEPLEDLISSFEMDEEMRCQLQVFMVEHETKTEAKRDI